MSEFTQEQEAEIQKRINEAKVMEQWTIAEDTLRRDLLARTEQMIAQGLWHPFLRDIAKTMFSLAIKREPQKAEPAKEEE